MILALLIYILHVYPQGVQVNHMADPFVRCMMEGASPSTWPAAETLAAMDIYKCCRLGMTMRTRTLVILALQL
ncbi:hypothetical protein B0J11DRAFT_240598 [Dendryphion nanum]|uniref:Uncharacterized protein n=1 Tax=Dendryphion nanum TaxID=256645 RepID=A0A9P9CXG2_9PLEO|nr:hypothetical protein B0J11DRAFT_240598 [Dendryphion nanum]